MMRITSVHSPGHSDMALPMEHVHSRTAECDSPPKAFDAAIILNPDNMRPETTSTVTVNMTANTSAPTNTTSALVGARKRKALRVIKHQVAVTVTPHEDLSEMKSVAVSMDQQSVVSDSGSRRGTPDSDPHYSNDGDDASSLSGTSGSPRSHACPLCGKLLSSGSSLDRHMLVHSGERPFKCKHCGAAFNTNGNMHRHTRTHCAALKEQSSSAVALPTPIHHHHHNNESDNDSDHSHSSYHSEASSTGKRRKRQSSDDEFSASLDLRQPPKSTTVHKYEEDDEAEIECLRSCSAAEKSSKEAFFSVLDLQLGQSPQPGSLNGSNRSANGWTPQPPMSPAMLSLSAQKIEDDLLSHEEDDPFSAHLREMKMRGEFPCKLCTAIFPNLRALKGHNRVHLTHPPYRCNLCPVVSSDKGALIRHMRTHNGERPYECKLCQFAFTTKANCERHLRNRHGQNTRDMLKAAIIYHANEDSTLINKPASSVSPEYRYSRSNKSDDLGSSGFLPSSDDQRPNPFSSLMQAFSLANEFQQQQSRATQYDDDEEDAEEERQLRRRERQELEEEEEDLDEEEEEDFQDAPLDLTVDVLDLSKKRQANGCPPPKTPSSHYTHQPTSVNETASAPASSQTPLHISPPSGLTPSSLFMPSLPYFASPFGHHPLPFFYNPSPFPGLEAKTSSEENSRYPANLDLSALALAAAHHDVLRQAQQHQMATESGLLMPVSSANVIHSTPIANSHSQLSVSASNPKSHLKSRAAEEEDKNAPVKMVIKNGVLMKKQKQRRYRTERPFGCEHCTARFTLRSNMERHIKQQHPDVWTTRPRGARRLAAAPASLLEMTPDSSSSTEVSRKESSSAVLANTKLAISDQVRQAITQQLKMKREHIKEEEKKHDDMEDEDEEEPEDDGELVIDEEKETAASSATAVVSNTVPHPKQPSSGGSHREEDLASVDKLLINAVAHNFQHYFQRNSEEMGEESGEHDTGAEDTECTSSEHSGSDESTSHRGEQDSSKPPKKKSAYSSAPHRVACPFCARKFPWTSSLRRHILTHTGQKPFKCPQCPLWFTTKSNCDRHLLRKHGNNNDYASAARSVPDRPYKCDLCPSSTFSSSDNLKKHQDSKHQHYCGGSEGGSSGSRTTSPTTSLLADEEGDAIMH